MLKSVVAAMEPPNKKRKGGGMSPGALERRRCEKMRAAEAMFAELPDLDLLDEYSPRTAMERTIARRAEEEAAQAAAKWNEDNEEAQAAAKWTEHLLDRTLLACNKGCCRWKRKAAADAANKEKEMQAKMAEGGQSGVGDMAHLRSCDSDSDDNGASASGTVADRERSMSDRERSDAENFGSEGEATDTEVPEPTAPWQQKRVTGSQLEEAVKMQRDESDEQQAKRNQALAKQLWQRGTKLWKEISEAESQLRAVKEKIIILGTKVRKATGNWSYTREAARKKMCRTPGKKSIKQIYAKWERIKQIYDKMGPKAKREKVRCRHAGELAGHERDARQADGRGRRSEERPD